MKMLDRLSMENYESRNRKSWIFGRKNHDMELIPWGDLNSSIQNGHEHVSNSRQIVSDLTAHGLGGQLWPCLLRDHSMIGTSGFSTYGGVQHVRDV